MACNRRFSSYPKTMKRLIRWFRSLRVSARMNRCCKTLCSIAAHIRSQKADTHTAQQQPPVRRHALPRRPRKPTPPHHVKVTHTVTEKKPANDAIASHWPFFTGRVISQVCNQLFLLFAGTIFMLFLISKELPIEHVQLVEKPPAIVSILDKDGQLITHQQTPYGQAIRLNDLPPHIIQAFLATEDRTFYHHLGINPLAMVRALLVNMNEGKVQQGGSTITQQLAKNLFLSPERTLKRKSQEILLAMWLEYQYSKDEILERYLNTVYFGAGAKGLHAAARRYFNKQPSVLSVGEAAMLAGLLKAPSRYAPTKSPTAAKKRTQIVLEAMHEAGYLNHDQVTKTLTDPVIATIPQNISGQYSVDYILEEVQRIIGHPSTDIIVRTTIDMHSTKKVEEIIDVILAIDTNIPDSAEVAIVIIDTGGKIRLLIGGRDYRYSQYNRAVKAWRQPGSAFKPFVFLAALEEGYRPEDIILDKPVEIDDWAPANYKGRYFHAIALEDALAKSLNAATIALQEKVGREKVRLLANNIGFSRKIAPGAALALGVNETTPLELASAYSVLAAGGTRHEPYIIQSIQQKDGTYLYQYPIEKGKKIISTQSSIAMNHMLRHVVKKGSGGNARLTRHVAAGKTGTTQNSKDAWFAGHANGLAGVVWVGTDDNTSMKGDSGGYASGSRSPAILWKKVMEITLKDTPPLPILSYEPTLQAPNFMRPLAKEEYIPSVYYHPNSAPTHTQEFIPEESQLIMEQMEHHPTRIDALLSEITNYTDN